MEPDLKRINYIFENDKYLHPLQFGFRSWHTTSSDLLNIIEIIRKAPCLGFYVWSILFDLQKAFDNVDREILFSKLYHYGCLWNTFSWFKSFLLNRS